MPVTSTKYYCKRKQKQNHISNKAKSHLNPQGLLQHLKLWRVPSVGLWCLCLINKRLLGLTEYIRYIIGWVKTYLCWLAGYCFRISLLLFFGGCVCWECLEEAEVTISQAITCLTYCPVPRRGTHTLNVLTETPLGEFMCRSIMFTFQALRTFKNSPARVCWHLQSPLLLQNWDLVLSRKAHIRHPLLHAQLDWRPSSPSTRPSDF